MNNGINDIVIIGAGPVGLLTALMLGKIGIHVHVFEEKTEIDLRPRGAAYGPSAVRVLRLAGVISKARKKGIDVKDLCWRELDGTYITGMTGLDNPNNLDRHLVLPVHLLAELLYEELKDTSNVKVYWGHKFKRLTQDETKVNLEIDVNGDTRLISADFVVGCDGARSEVRKSLFGSRFPGRSWDVQIVATNIKYDGFNKHGWSDAQWVVHPEHWFLSCRLDREGTWRVAYGEPVHLDAKELRERLPAKFKKILPGSPDKGDYEVLTWSPFVMHQRCAEQMCVGRVLLAGDSAHLCNPMGGLGLTGGIADVGSLVDCLRGIHQGAATLKILEMYDKERRAVYNKFIDPISSGNLKRLFLDGNTVLEQDKILQLIQAASQDPVIARQLQEAENVLTVDMTQFYDIES